MDEEAIRKLSTVDWDEAAPRLLGFAHRWAANLYGWRSGTTLPNGMGVEDVVKDAVSAFATGGRKFNPRFEIVVGAYALAREQAERLSKVVTSFAPDGTPPSEWLRPGAIWLRVNDAR